MSERFTFPHGELGIAPLFKVRDFEGSLGEYVDYLWWQYRAIVHDAGIMLWGKPVVAYDDRAEDGRDALFWHLISDSVPGADSRDRRFSILRAACLPVVWDVLERFARDDPRVCSWRAVERRRRKRAQRDCAGHSKGHPTHAVERIWVAPIDFSVVVILEERAEYVLLHSAIPAPSPRAADKQYRKALAALGLEAR